MERMIAVHAVTTANKDTVGTVDKNLSDTTGYKLQLRSKSIVKPPSHMRIKIERALADFSVVANTDVKTIVENQATKRTHTLQSRISKAVKPIF